MGGGAERVSLQLHQAGLDRGIDSHLAVGFRFGDTPHTAEIPNDANRSWWARNVLRAVPALPPPPATLSPEAVALRRGLKAIAEPGRALRRAEGLEDFDYPGTMAVLAPEGVVPDVVHLHNLHGGYFDLRCLPEISSHVPVVATLHDTWLLSGHCAYPLECERWRTGCGECPHLDTYPAVARDSTEQNWQRKRDLLSRSRLHVVGPSRWVLDRAADSIVAAGAVQMRHIPNGVDQRVFTPGDKQAARRELGLPTEPLMLVFSAAGRTSAYKDVGTIAASLSAIVELVAPRPVLLVSLGAWIEDDRTPGAEVLSVPFTPDPRVVARYLQAADLAIHAARAETLGLVILEAQSCGLPVVATAVGGIPETIADGVTGLLVPPEDPAALARAAGELLLDAPRREAMGTAAIERARSLFGLDRMVGAYFDLYGEVAQRA